MTRDWRRRIGIAGFAVGVIGALSTGIDHLLGDASPIAVVIPFVCAAVLATVGVHLVRQSSDPPHTE